MESVGTICEGEWNSSFNGMCSDEADFMAQLLGSCSLPNASFWAANESNYEDARVEEANATNMLSFSLGNSIISPSFSEGSYYPFVNSNSLMAMDYSAMYGKNSGMIMEGDDFLNQDASNESVDSDEKLHVDVLEESFKEDKISSPCEISRKRPQIPAGSQRSKRFKKCDENDDNNTTSNNVVLHRQSSSGCCSEDDSNASQETNNGVKSSSSSKRSGGRDIKGKARASRGSATDPQSLYARKRRERINERLRILQTLVPNGTKVDISTMLEEAVQYVKFLQLQIKLLSSDDLWMYAPIAYNGMEMMMG